MDGRSLRRTPFAQDFPVAMMAGRGLGHSQGTLDKLDAVPGWDSTRDRLQTLRLIDDCGAAIIAQTEDIAPADRTLYALRDVTGTVPSLPLIVGSIMSKKLALGASALILDVKWGSGAMTDDCQSSCISEIFRRSAFAPSFAISPMAR